MPLKNPYISYTDRSYEQIDQSIEAKMPVFVPEVTDKSDSNPLVKFRKIFAGLTEQLNYYLDRKAQESYIGTCKRFTSAVKIAKQFDYRIKGSFPSNVLERFYFDNPIPSDLLIPIGTEVQTKPGISFLTIEQKTILAGTSYVDINMKQWLKIVSQVLGTSNGAADQVFEIILPSNTVGQVVDFNIQVSDGVDIWAQKDTLAFSAQTDKHIVTRINANGNMEVFFGDSVNGAIPAPGPLTVTYYVSQGTEGNLAENQITEIKTNITVPSGYILKATNPQRSSGGTNPEGLVELRKRIPYSFRTLRRAVIEQDYKDIAAMSPGVAKSDVIFNCGKTVNVYIAPTGGGIAAPSLLTDVENFFADKKMVTTRVKAFSAGIIRLKIEVNVKVLPNYYNELVAEAVKQALAAFGDVSNQNIRGEIALGDLYEHTEETAGVDNSEFIKIVPIPYARVTIGTHELSWTPETLSASVSSVRWQIKINTSTTFYVFRNNIYMGIFNLTDLIEFPEVRFIIVGNSYSIGDSWEFWTYRYNGTLRLEEFSIPTIYAADVTVNTSGGL